MFRILQMLALLSFSASVHANTFVTIQDFTLWSSTYGDDQIRVIPTAIENPDSCTDPDSYYIDSTLPQEVKARIYSTLLAAVMGNKEVTVILNGCEGVKPKITTVTIK